MSKFFFGSELRKAVRLGTEEMDRRVDYMSHKQGIHRKGTAGFFPAAFPWVKLSSMSKHEPTLSKESHCPE